MTSQTIACKRRSFLSQAIVGVTGATLLNEASRAKSQQPDKPCLGSASDAIILLLDLLFEVQGEAYIEAGQELRRESLNCADTLKIFYDDIEDLLKRLKEKQSGTSHQRISDTLQLARSNMRLVTAPGLTAPQLRLALASLSVVNKEISDAAQDLLPSGQIVLDEEAKKILQRIIDFAHRAKTVPEATRQGEKNYSEKIAVIRENFQTARKAVFDASTAAESNTKSEAQVHVNAAITALRMLPNPPSTSTRKSAVDRMIECLEGAMVWVEVGAQSVPIVFDKLDGKIKLNPAFKKHHAEMENEPATDSAFVQGVGGLLDVLCQPNNRSRRGICYWAAGMAWLRHPQNAQGRIFLIAGALTRFACEPVAAKDELIKALAGA